MWVPKNKTTGIEYPPVTDAGRSAMEKDPMTSGKYTFKAVQGAAKPTAVPKEPIGKKISPKEPETQDKTNVGDTAL